MHFLWVFIIKMEVDIRGAAGFADAVEQYIATLVFRSTSTLCRIVVAAPVHLELLYHFSPLIQNLGVIVVRRGHDSFSCHRCMNNNHSISINVIHGTASVHIVAICRVQFKDRPFFAYPPFPPFPFQCQTVCVSFKPASVESFISVSLPLVTLINKVYLRRSLKATVVFIVTIRPIPLGNPVLVVGVAFSQPIAIGIRIFEEVSLLQGAPPRYRLLVRMPAVRLR